MLDDSAVFLICPRQKSRDIFKRHQRDVEAIAKAYEARAFNRRIDIERSGQHRRLVRDHSHRLPVQARKSHHNVLRIMFLDFEEIPVVDNCVDHVFHVVRQVRLIGDDRVELLVGAVDGIGTRPSRWVINMYEVWSTIRMKSVMAGEYTAPPAHGPMMAEICGTTPL